MKLWEKIFGGNIADTLKAADSFVYTKQEQAEDAQDEVKTITESDAAISSHNGIFNDLVDAYNRLIRPGVITWLVGGFSGWWKLPDPGTIDPFWQNAFWLVITFLFGGRALLKDIPGMINAFRRK